MPPLTLAQTQLLLRQLITAPSGVTDGLRALGDAGGLLTDGLETIVNGDPVLPAARRLDIYANMYFFRLLDAIKEDFPTVLALVGADEFHNLTTDYLLRHPPVHFSLRYAGEHLPSFLGACRLRATHPFLSDVARFEWSLVEAFDAADATTIEPAALAAIDADAWPGLRLQLAPSLRLLALDWVAPEPWHCVQDRREPGRPTQRATWLRTWRTDLRVLHREIAPDEFAALSAAARGETLATVCDAVAGDTTGSADERIAELLQQWFADGLVVSAA